MVECEHLCILSHGEEQIRKERFVGLRDKSQAAFHGHLPRAISARLEHVRQDIIGELADLLYDPPCSFIAHRCNAGYGLRPSVVVHARQLFLGCVGTVGQMTQSLAKMFCAASSMFLQDAELAWK